MKHSIRIFVWAAALSTILAGQIMADGYFRQATHVDAFEVMGQKSPEKNDTTTLWLGETKACSQTGPDEAVIFDSEKNVMYFINHQAKEYSVIAIDKLGEGASAAGQMPPGMPGGIEITVTPTEETAKIGEWNVTKYATDINIAMMPSKQELWATEDIKPDGEMFNAISNGMMAQMPGFDKILAEMQKIKGIPVKTVTHTSAMGAEFTTTTELLEYAEKDAPDGIYDIPEGYKEVAGGMPMGRGGR